MSATARQTALKKQIRNMYLAQFLEKPYVNTAVAQRRLGVAEIIVRADSNVAIVIAAVDSATNDDHLLKDHDHLPKDHGHLLKDHDFLPC